MVLETNLHALQGDQHSLPLRPKPFILSEDLVVSSWAARFIQFGRLDVQSAHIRQRS
jgi:hypothetical protein